MNEGAYVGMPDGSNRMAWRYFSWAAVPWYHRGSAVQIGRMGYWYVPDDLSDAGYRPTVGEQVAVGIENVNQALGADRGVLGIFSRLLGLPYWLSVVLVVFVAYALLRGAGLVPPLRGVVK